MIIRTFNRLRQPASLCSSTFVCSSSLGNSKTSSLRASSQVLSFVFAVSSRFARGKSTIVKILPHSQCFSTSTSRPSSSSSPSSSTVTPSYLKACEHPDRTAVIDYFGRHSYGDLLRRAIVLSDALDDATPYPLATSLQVRPYGRRYTLYIRPRISIRGCVRPSVGNQLFLSELNNSVVDYNSSRVGVVCRLSISNFKLGIISKRFDLEG